jgi:hypothetical protein
MWVRTILESSSTKNHPCTIVCGVGARTAPAMKHILPSGQRNASMDVSECSNQTVEPSSAGRHHDGSAQHVAHVSLWCERCCSQVIKTHVPELALHLCHVLFRLQIFRGVFTTTTGGGLGGILRPIQRSGSRRTARSRVCGSCTVLRMSSCKCLQPVRTSIRGLRAFGRHGSKRGRPGVPQTMETAENADNRA